MLPVSHTYVSLYATPDNETHFSNSANSIRFGGKLCDSSAAALHRWRASESQGIFARFSA